MPAAATTAKMVRRRHRQNRPAVGHHDVTLLGTTTKTTSSKSSSSTSITEADARANFVASVTQGLSVLMDRGFSRERATAVLLRELVRDIEEEMGEVGASSSTASTTTTSSSSNTKPTDQEVSTTH